MYKLESTVLIAEAGTSASLKLNCPQIQQHTLKKDHPHDEMTANYQIKNDEITFYDVSTEDRGTYTITCNNGNLKSSASFSLDVTLGK